MIVTLRGGIGSMPLSINVAFKEVKNWYHAACLRWARIRIKVCQFVNMLVGACRVKYLRSNKLSLLSIGVLY